MDRGITRSDWAGTLTSPELQLIYETAPIGLAFLSTDSRYLLINQHLTEICGISVAEHIGRSVRETVPDVAVQVESIVQTVLRTGEPVVGIEVNGQRPDKQNAERYWTTNWHPLKGPEGTIIGISVVSEEITERKRTEAVPSICRSIIESHGGKLWALPRSPFGTTFYLTLPSAETADRTDLDNDDSY
jgi:PAS domain S-box-containing protein